LTVDVFDVHVLLITLRDRFSLAERERKQELRTQWNTLASATVKDSGLDAMIMRWENLYQECKAAKVSMTLDDDDAIYDFLTAIKSVDPQFLYTWYQKTFRQDDKVTFTGMLNAFRSERAAFRPKKGHRATYAFATLDGQEEANKPQKDQQAQRQISHNNRRKWLANAKCVC
jgi:hypothetical protein